MIEKISWEQFRASGLLWFINRIIHLFGMTIVVECDKDGNVKDVYPAKCKFRGFGGKSESEGFKNITEFLEKNIPRLKEETQQ
jgi:hypothetical protein